MKWRFGHWSELNLKFNSRKGCGCGMLKSRSRVWRSCKYMKGLNTMREDLSFENLVASVAQIQELTSGRAKNAVNQLLTIRNWMIGYYIVEFEMNGKNRADYGTHLLKELEKSINIKGMNQMLFYNCRTFYTRYPQIFSTVSKKLGSLSKSLSLPDKISFVETELEASEKLSTASKKFETDPEMLITRLSFSHIREIMALDDPLERFFYEFECIKGVWSVRELKRQIASQLYFRAGISKKPELLLERIQKNDFTASLTVKDPYTFEFLGLDDRLAMTESALEKALLDHLQEFFLELGKGFCLEARQKRLLIDDDYYYPDLVFYNRYLRCNVIVDLKVHEFRHEELGQLNAYVGYYKMNEMAEGDNPPCGILLCTEKGPQMVEYALSGMNNQLFVSTYMLQLPDKKQLEEFLEKEVRELQS